MQTAKSALRDRNRQWRKFDYSDAEGKKQDTIYVNVDRNRFQKKREADAKRLLRACHNAIDNCGSNLVKQSNISWIRHEGVITYKGKPLARLEPEDDDEPSSVKWCPNCLGSLPECLKRADILADYPQNRPTHIFRASELDRIEWTI